MPGGDSPVGHQHNAPGPDRTTDQAVLHASCVSLGARGALIIGASGSGKSSLALEMMARGAALIADDRVNLIRQGQTVFASAPPALSGLIEARGIGLLQAKVGDPVAIACVVDLGQSETNRMPPLRYTQLLGQTVTLLFRVDSPHFPSALVQYLKAGRHEA